MKQVKIELPAAAHTSNLLQEVVGLGGQQCFEIQSQQAVDMVSGHRSKRFIGKHHLSILQDERAILRILHQDAVLPLVLTLRFFRLLGL